MDNLGYRKAIEELMRGHDCAKQLKHVINGTCYDGTSSSSTPFAEQLVKEVLMSFTNTILFLNNNTSQPHDVSNVQASDSPKSEDSQESNCKSFTVKERRGCYKRRRTEQTWEKESEAPIDDGHQWRKYGQKEILNAKFPRNYYRCTHKFDQGCKATKQVQRVEEDPILYKTTYYGHHTCKNLNPEIILDPISHSSSSKFLSFDNSFPTPSQQECPFLSSSFPSSVKRDCKEEMVPPSTSSNDYLISSELTFDNSPRHHVTLSSTLDSEYKGVVDISDVLCDSAQLHDVFEPFLQFR